VKATRSGAVPAAGAAVSSTDGARLPGSGGTTVIVTVPVTLASPSETVTSGSYVPGCAKTRPALAPLLSACPSPSKSQR
jgi:hypothetical protein